MKSQPTSVLTIYAGILKDATTVWPDLVRAFGQDLSYLRRAAEQRGLAFFTLTLPALGKVVDDGLARGYINYKEFPLGVTLCKKQPELFSGLFQMIFSKQGYVLESLDIVAIQYLRQLCYTAKKLRVEYDTIRLHGALKEYYEIESSIPPSQNDFWTTVHYDHADDFLFPFRRVEGVSSEFDELHIPALRRLCRHVVMELGPIDWWALQGRHGPGAVAEGGGYRSKYDFLHWPASLDSVFPYDWFASGKLDSVPDYNNEERPSRLIAVPKTHKGPRLICSEPIAKQWMQQALRCWLEERMEKSVLRRSITLRNQERSRERALTSSLDREYCTVDLSSASDRLECDLVGFIFQVHEDLLKGFRATRSTHVVQTISPDFPKEIELRKFAPMGSALTFPVQSIVYAILSVHALRIAEGRTHDSEWEADFDRIIVYGDDIIAPVNAFRAIKCLFEACGLRVNSHKSYAEGYFRESCGMDAYKGVDVTPAYFTQVYDGSATSTASIVEVSNNFYKKGYWHTAKAIECLLPPEEHKLLPIAGGDVSGLGLFSFMGHSHSHLKKVWNKDLQKEESIVLDIATKATRVRGTDQSGLTQYFTEDPSQKEISHWESGQVRRVRTRKVRTRVTRL